MILFLSALFSEDNSKLKSLTLHIEHMTKESQEKRKLLDKEVLETLIAQVRKC